VASGRRHERPVRRAAGDKEEAMQSAAGRPSPPAVEVAGLVRSFGDTGVLAGVDLELESGGVFGLLGANGAGKTTTVRILTGVLHPDRAGSLRVLGHDLPDQIAAVRPHIGVQTDTALYDRLTGLDNLVFFGRLYGMSAADAGQAARALLDRFGLGDRQGDRVGTWSKGMKQKALIARALIADPELVFLDEPTAGLDPEAAHELMTYIHDLSSERGRSFFITSHRLEEMESVCTKVGVLSAGRIAAQGAPAEVARMLVPEVRVRVTVAPHTALDEHAIDALDGVRGVTLVHGGAVVELTDREAVPAVVRAIAGMPGDLLGVAEEPPTLEEAYLRLVHQHEAEPVAVAGAR
jgi:ABC-2 type transport system ATP-binding protein